jgi:hypothetical protein
VLGENVPGTVAGSSSVIPVHFADGCVVSSGAAGAAVGDAADGMIGGIGLIASGPAFGSAARTGRDALMVSCGISFMTSPLYRL